MCLELENGVIKVWLMLIKESMRFVMVQSWKDFGKSFLVKNNVLFSLQKTFVCVLFFLKG